MRSAERALLVLMEVAKATGPTRPEVDLHQIASALELPKPTAHRVLQLLTDYAFIYKNPVTRRYRLGVRSSWLGRRARLNPTVDAVAQPFLQQLADETGETVTLNVRVGARRLCLDCVPGKSELRVIPTVGETYPLHIGSTGKLLLAFADPDERLDLVRQFQREGLITSVAEFESLLKTIREKGYCTATGERVAGVAAVTVPIMHAAKSSEPLGSVTVVLPLVRFSKDIETFLLRLLHQGAEAIHGAYVSSGLDLEEVV